MVKMMNKLIFEKHMIFMNCFGQNIYAEINENKGIVGITAVMGENWLYFSAKISVNMLIFLFFNIFIIVPKFPKCFLEILVLIIYFFTNIPEAFGEFWSIIKMNFID